MPEYIGAIDQGTSSSRFMVFARTGEIVSSHQIEHDTHFSSPGWAEHDPEMIFTNVQECIRKTVEKMVQQGLEPRDIRAIGITNQRETTCVWDKSTGRPLHNAIVWLDVRTRETVDSLIQKTDSKKADHFLTDCGLPLATYFSAVKLRWLLDHVPEVAKAQEDGRLQVGTVDSWLIYKLTGGCSTGVHVTDVTNASRTMLMNLKTLQWDDALCNFFGVDRAALPEIRSSSETYGVLADGPLKGLPVAGCLGDQQAALVGQLCMSPGEAKNTYGTGCFMLFNTGSTPIISRNGLLTTVGYQLGKTAPAVYALEGSIAIAGAAVKWLRDNLGIIQSAEEINVLASNVSDSAGVYFVPAFSGLFAPHWRPDARGCIVGLTQYSTKEHIARAALEAVCLQTKEILLAMNSDSGHPLTSLKVDGGLTNSDLCMQIQANVIGITVERPKMRETTALGAALAAGLAVGVWASVDEFRSKQSIDRFESKSDEQERERMFNKWKKAIEKSLGWEES
ncbi:uncharacterized protein BJ171DRAFT_214366 [Polychytrium aggregatum]|uniref:uncharacterized protein n=1 Tax=Polychytrium aggregatum TaxID=110093 RepID=UPI0022FF2307|nr:uncharacterized protein BJ171DRAFT_214366 [Polychytrium aggregatum]KAI9199464.1 hypothetical protein BJ171DRAFT_214366 [Polychytrium aggregatum]